jgi:pimeloyl-ACP methyl ester carboxylesterase
MQIIAEEEESVGHMTTALNRYFDASTLYAHAQHVIFENNAEKSYLHAASLRCFDHVRQLAPYRIEHINIDWSGGVLSGNLHLANTTKPAPLVFYIPGCDQTKEMFPHPLLNQALQRDMHIFSFDGPGQGESNLRGIKLTPTNYEEAASAAIDYLISRPEIDPKLLVVYAMSFGSHWGVRIASKDSRVHALAAPWASYCEKYHLLDDEAPRWKQLFMYLTGVTTEADLDEIADAMSVRGMVGAIACPTLLAVGEYDPRSPLEEVYEIFDELTCPAELWVFADQHHAVSLARPNAEANYQSDSHDMALDWLRDRCDGKPMANERQVVYLEPASGHGPYAPAVSRRRRWYEEG